MGPQRASLGPYEIRKKKGLTQPLKDKKIPGEPRKITWPGHLGTPRSLGSPEPGILGTCNRARFGLRQIKGVPRNTRNKRRYVPISHPMMQKRIRRLGDQ